RRPSSPSPSPGCWRGSDSELAGADADPDRPRFRQPAAVTAIVAAVGWLAGLVAAPTLPPLDLASAAPLLAAALGLAWLCGARPAAGLAAVALAAALRAVLRAQSAERSAAVPPGSVADYADLGLAVELRGRIVAEPEPVDRGARLRVAA